MPEPTPRAAPTPRLIIASLFVVTVHLLACQEAPTQLNTGVPTTLVAVDGDGQSAQVYAALPDPLVVRVEDEAGDPVANIPIVWAVESGGALVADEARTDDVGEARAVWTLSGQPGMQQATAAGAGLDTLRFSATATPADPAEVTLISGNGQEGEVGTALDVAVVVRVLDDQGRPVREALVNWTADGGGSFSPAEVETDADGEAEAVWTVGETAGEQTATVEVGSVDAIILSAIATPGPYDRLEVLAAQIQWVTLGDLTGAGGPSDANTDSIDVLVTPAVRLEDRYGNPLAGEVVRFTAGSSSSVASEAIETNAEGVARADLWSFPSEVGGYVLTTTITEDQLEGPRFGVNVYRPLVLEEVRGGTRTGYTCGLDGSGVAYCWADGSPWGVLPEQVAVGDAPFAELAGGFTTYGRTAEGDLYRLGAVGSTFGSSFQATPAPFEGLAAGQDHYCGLTASGEVYCWGNNGSGRLGRDTILVTSVDPEDAQPVEGAPPLVDIAAGWRTSCGLTAEGAAYCWGLNDWGQVGDSTQSNRETAQPVVGGHTFAALALGHRYSCGLEANGAVYCWGREFMEDGSEVVRLAPTRVADDFEFVQLSAGEYHVCGLQDDGRVLCWRRDEEGDGVFGDGTAEVRLVRQTPQPVAWDEPFTDVASNQWATCGTTAGGVVCWGRWDILGFPYNTHPDSHLPVYVTAPDTTGS